jgi:hypothetical protein
MEESKIQIIIHMLMNLMLTKIIGKNWNKLEKFLSQEMTIR